MRRHAAKETRSNVLTECPQGSSQALYTAYVGTHTHTHTAHPAPLRLASVRAVQAAATFRTTPCARVLASTPFENGSKIFPIYLYKQPCFTGVRFTSNSPTSGLFPSISDLCTFAERQTISPANSKHDAPAAARMTENGDQLIELEFRFIFSEKRSVSLFQQELASKRVDKPAVAR